MLVVNLRTAGASTLTASLFNGGQGPFHAEAWAALSTSDEATTFSGTDVRVRLGEVWLGGPNGTAFELPYIRGDDATVNGVTWWHYEANLPNDLPPTCLFVVEALQPNADLLLTGPAVVPAVLHMNAAGHTLVFRPAVQGRWLARDRALMTLAKEQMPQPGSPLHVRMEQIKRAVKAGQGLLSPVR